MTGGDAIAAIAGRFALRLWGLRGQLPACPSHALRNASALAA